MSTFLNGTTLGTKPPGGDRLVQDAAPEWGSKNAKECVCEDLPANLSNSGLHVRRPGSYTLVYFPGLET